LFFKTIQILLLHLIHLLAAVCRATGTSLYERSSHSESSVLYSNRNYNNVTASLFSGDGAGAPLKTTQTCVRNLYTPAFLSLHRMKPVAKHFFVDEKSNHYPFVGQTDPGSAFREQ
jgi:hypothetical protein